MSDPAELRELALHLYGVDTVKVVPDNGDLLKLTTGVLALLDENEALRRTTHEQNAVIKLMSDPAWWASIAEFERALDAGEVETWPTYDKDELRALIVDGVEKQSVARDLDTP